METRIIVVLLDRLDVIGRLRVTGNRLNLVKVMSIFVYLAWRWKTNDRDTGSLGTGQVSDSYSQLPVIDMITSC